MDEVAVLVLNGGFEPLHFTNARRAITLLLSGKAESVEPSPRVVRSPSRAFPLPSVIRLAIYIRKPFVERVAFNKKNILRRDHYTCQYCGRRGDRLTVDHVVPRSKGGKTTWENIVSACYACNRTKANRTPAEAGLKLRLVPKRPTWMPAVQIRVSTRSVPDAWRDYVYWTGEVDSEEGGAD